MSDENKKDGAFTVGASIREFLNKLSKSIGVRVVTRILTAQKAFIDTLISKETKTRLLKAEEAKIVKLTASEINVIRKANIINSDNKEEIENLNDTISLLEERISKISENIGKQISSLNKRIDELDAAIKTTSSNLTNTDKTVKSLNDQLNELREEFDTTIETISGQLDDTDEIIESVKERLADDLTDEQMNDVVAIINGGRD